MAGRDLCQNGYDKVRAKVRDPSSLCYAEAGKVSLSGGPA